MRADASFDLGEPSSSSTGFQSNGLLSTDGSSTTRPTGEEQAAIDTDPEAGPSSVPSFVTRAPIRATTFDGKTVYIKRRTKIGLAPVSLVFHIESQY